MTYLRSPCSNIRPPRNGPPRFRPGPENHPMKSGSNPHPPRPAPGLSVPHQKLPLHMSHLLRYDISKDISAWAIYLKFLRFAMRREAEHADAIRSPYAPPRNGECVWRSHRPVRNGETGWTGSTG